MNQMSFFDLANRYVGLDAKNNPLPKLSTVIPWEDFRGRLEAARRTPPAKRKSKAGRRPLDAVMMWRVADVNSPRFNL